ncbi:WW domain [Sesbania bispinosa]|nr:WW domain [Sesbania bispinosa]
MALAAINGLNKTFTMRGCDHPLVVRFADPKKPKTGESSLQVPIFLYYVNQARLAKWTRGNYLSGNANLGPCSQEPPVWPVPNFCDSNTKLSIPHIAPHHSTIAHLQVPPHMPNWETGATLVPQPFLPQQAHSQLASMPLRSIQAPNLSSQPFINEVQRQSHPADSSVQNVEQQLSSQLPAQTGSNPNIVAGSTSPDLPTSPLDEDPPECDWSEHYCPDGHKYYYNCVTCESKWEKPEEYALYEKESQKQQEQEDHSCLHSQSPVSCSQEVAQRQETNHDYSRSKTSPVVGQV